MYLDILVLFYFYLGTVPTMKYSTYLWSVHMCVALLRYLLVWNVSCLLVIKNVWLYLLEFHNTMSFFAVKYHLSIGQAAGTSI